METINLSRKYLHPLPTPSPVVIEPSCDFVSSTTADESIDYTSPASHRSLVISQQSPTDGCVKREFSFAENTSAEYSIAEEEIDVITVSPRKEHRFAKSQTDRASPESESSCDSPTGYGYQHSLYSPYSFPYGYPGLSQFPLMPYGPYASTMHPLYQTGHNSDHKTTGSGKIHSPIHSPLAQNLQRYTDGLNNSSTKDTSSASLLQSRISALYKRLAKAPSDTATNLQLFYQSQAISMEHSRNVAIKYSPALAHVVINASFEKRHIALIDMIEGSLENSLAVKPDNENVDSSSPIDYSMKRKSTDEQRDQNSNILNKDYTGKASYQSSHSPPFNAITINYGNQETGEKPGSMRNIDHVYQERRESFKSIQNIASNLAIVLPKSYEERRLEMKATKPLVSDKKCKRGNPVSRRFSAQSTAILSNWYETHFDHPYPTRNEFVRLAETADITVGQLKTWLTNKRMRDARRKR